MYKSTKKVYMFIHSKFPVKNYFEVLLGGAAVQR